MIEITPEGKQNKVLALPAKGHIIVLGTAGSGKTTIALLRAINLSNLPKNEKVLLVTFNRSLVKYMRGVSGIQSSKLNVENYHKFARGYLYYRGKMPTHKCILDPREKEHYIRQSVEYYKDRKQIESTLNRPLEFFIDEIAFIEKFGFSNVDEYYRAERVGRASANIRRENRKWIYAVYEKYIKLRKLDGWEYDWDDLASHVYSELEKDTSPRRYNHIIIDEGQDFSPMMIKSLVNAVHDGGSFTFFGDVAQQIYGSRLSWRDSGINTDKIWRFDVNYRNPATIIAFTNDIIKSEYWQRDTDMVEAAMQIAEGPKPILVKFKYAQHEMDWVIRRAISAGRTSSAVIICRNRAIIDKFRRMFRDKGYEVTEINKETTGYAHAKTIYLTTFHSSKGLEFDNVFIPFLTEGIFPDKDTIDKAISDKEVYADEIKLLYVAATRSKYGLYMSYHDTLSPLFPVSSGNYDLFEGEAQE
jgi:superfamily I DNA/RNA helicase